MLSLVRSTLADWIAGVFVPLAALAGVAGVFLAPLWIVALALAILA